MADNNSENTANKNSEKLPRRPTKNSDNLQENIENAADKKVTGSVQNSEKARTNTVSIKATTRRTRVKASRKRAVFYMVNHRIFSTEKQFCWKYAYGMIQLRRSFTVLLVLVRKLFYVPLLYFFFLNRKCDQFKDQLEAVTASNSNIYTSLRTELLLKS